MRQERKHKDVYILGIHDGHHAGAAIVKNGEVLAAISEERLTGLKCDASPPFFSILAVLSTAHIDPSQIQIVSIGSLQRLVADWRVENTIFLYRLHMMLAPLFHGKWFNKLAIELLHHLTPRTDLLTALRVIGITAPVVYVEHHIAHAASTYYSRPWKDASLVFTMDGMGDGFSSTVSVGRGMDMTRIAASTYYDSIGNNIYAEITRYLGMARGEHEYKVMGLAPYGDPTETAAVFHEVIRLNPKNRLEFQNTKWAQMERLEPYYERKLKYRRFDHVAAGVQTFFEEIVTAWVKEAIRQTNIHNICLAGGSFLNIKANMLLREMDEVRNVFIYPASDDSGIPVGAAIISYITYCKEHHIPCRISPIGSVYYGQEFPDEYVEELLQKKRLIHHAKKVGPDDIARRLAQGQIIARFAGRDEWGPRALGNRSILADPRKLEMVDILNRKIKHRDFWMPFAPAILAEDQAQYLKHPRFSPYMTEAFRTTKYAKDIIATVHPADQTTRPMTVNDWNKPFQEIVRAFRKQTGVGALVNTSFNLHGYPLVGTPEQALWTFQNTGLDGLLLNDWLLTKRL